MAEKRVAIIGSRRMSLYGKMVVEWLIDGLMGKEVVVVTGDVAGVNREVIRLAKAKKIKMELVGARNGMEKMNWEIANKSDILVVVEGGKNSGTMLVAKNFLDLGKEVWSVPGNVFTEGSWTTNWLIANGANILRENTWLVDRAW